MPSPPERSRSARIARLTNSGNRTPRLASALSRAHARLFRATGGRFIGRWFGAPVMVLETIGRRSGQRRATPVLYLEAGNDLVVLASNAGSDKPPAWWLNLRDAGEGTVVLGGRRREVRPRVAEGEERAELWRRFCAMYPSADDYRDFTEREFPLVVLETASRQR